jgi:lysozyme family protein
MTSQSTIEEETKAAKSLKNAIDYLNKTQFDSRGPLAFARSNASRSANAGLLQSNISIDRVRDQGKFSDPSKIFLRNLSDLTDESITANSKDSKKLLEQLNLMSKELRHIKDDEERAKVQQLFESVRKDLRSNASMVNRLSEHLEDNIPDIAGMATAITGTPLAGLVVSWITKGLIKAIFKSEKKTLQAKLARELVNVAKNTQEIQKEEKEKVEAVVQKQEEIVQALTKPKRQYIRRNYGVLNVQTLNIGGKPFEGSERAVERVEEEITEIGSEVKGLLSNIMKVTEESPVATAVERVESTVKSLTDVAREATERAQASSKAFLDSNKSMIQRLGRTPEEKADDNWYREQILANLKAANEKKIEAPEEGKGFFGKLLSGLGSMGALGGGLFGGIIGSLTTTLIGMAKGMILSLSRFVMTAVPRLLARLPILAIVGSFFKGLFDGYKKWAETGSIGDALMSTLNGFADSMVTLFSFGMLNLDKVNEFVATKMQWLGDMVFGSVDALFEMWVAPFQFFRDMLGTAWITLQKAFSPTLEAIGALWEDFNLENLKTVFANFYDGIITYVTTIFDEIQNWAGRKIDSLLEKVGIVREGASGGLGFVKDQGASFLDMAGSALMRLNPANQIMDLAGMGIGSAQAATTPARSVAGGPDSFIDRLMSREGGFVNHRADRGGATNMGITQKTLSDHLGRQASVDEVQNLDPALAKQIYQQKYMKPFEGVEDQKLRELLFDTGVHSGTGRAKEFLENSQAKGLSGDDLFADILDQRRNFLQNLAKNDPSQQVFLKGWMNRLNEFELMKNDNKELATNNIVQNREKIEATQTEMAANAGQGKGNTNVNSTSVVNNNQQVLNRRPGKNPDSTIGTYYRPNYA